MIIFWIALGFSTGYLFLQIYYLYHWHLTKVTFIPPGFVYTQHVSIIIIARNEENHIATCLQRLLAQSYPKDLIEIIVIDDHSSDGTFTEIKKIGSERISVYRLEDFPEYIHAPAYKKSGISLAVSKAKTENIVVTDADCIHENDWLRSVIFSMDAQQAVFQTSPVLLAGGHTLVEKMQEIEQLTLMLITGAGITSGLHDIANGANMAFTKSAFLKVNGYVGNEQFASGDDMFLIEKIRKIFPDKIAFNKSINASVSTQAKKTWSSLMQQRIRWAGKNKGLHNKMISRIWTFVGLYHIFLLLSLVASLFNLVSPIAFIILFAVKWFADFLIITSAAAFFQKTSVLRYFVPLQFLYTFYILRLGFSIITGKKGDWQRS